MNNKKVSFYQKKIEFPTILYDLSAFFLFLVVAAYLFNITLFRWGDLIVDTFREFYLPTAILDGKVLYRDIYYEYGFFAPYFIAGWFKLFGISILSLALCGFSVLMATVMAIYKIISLFVNKFLSFFVGIIFLLVFAFGNYCSNGIFNFILPYSFASIFFIVFLTWSIYFFLKFILYNKFSCLLAWACLFTCACITRIEFSLLVWIGFLTTLLIHTHRIKTFLSLNKIIFSPLLVSFFLYFTFFTITNSFTKFESLVLGLVARPTGVSYSKSVMGLDDLHINILRIFYSFLWQLIILACATMGAFLAKLVIKKIKNVWWIVLVSVISFLFIIIGIYCTDRWIYFFIQYNALPILLIIGSVFSLFKIITNSDRKIYTALFSLFIVALLLLTRVFFNVMPNLYVFFLVIPGLIGYYILFYKIIADILCEIFHDFPRPVYIIILSFIFLFQAFLFCLLAHEYYSQKRLAASTNKGIYYSYYDTRTIAYWSTVHYLMHYTKPSDTVLVVPEGLGINFFADRKNPTPYLGMHPGYVEIFTEEKIISDIDQSKVNYIIFCARITNEQGSPYFGATYAQKIYAWLINHYTLVKQFGPYPFTSPEFGIAIFKRK